VKRGRSNLYTIVVVSAKPVTRICVSVKDDFVARALSVLNIQTNHGVPRRGRRYRRRLLGAPPLERNDEMQVDGVNPPNLFSP